MNHNHHHQQQPILLALRRGNSTPASTAAPDTVPQPHHAFSFPNGFTKLPPPIVIDDPASSSPLLTSYTSLKEILPTPILSSPIADISIRHRLAKQAAWAYFQPAAVSPVSLSPSPSLGRLWANFSSCFCHVVTFVARLLRRFFMAGPVRFTR